jgi:hypothetical protein
MQANARLIAPPELFPEQVKHAVPEGETNKQTKQQHGHATLKATLTDQGKMYIQSIRPSVEGPLACTTTHKHEHQPLFWSFSRLFFRLNLETVKVRVLLCTTHNLRSAWSRVSAGYSADNARPSNSCSLLSWSALF